MEESGFIEHFAPYNSTKNSLYRLTDEYSAFYIKYIENNKPAKNGVWNKLQQQASFRSWSGFTFETICIKHIEQIKEALKISGVNSYCGNWIEKNHETGAQIDLLIDRDDNVINLCEIKFYNAPFAIDKKYSAELIHKLNTFKTSSNVKKSIFITFITAYGLIDNEYSKQLVQNSLTMEDLFTD